MCVSKHGGGVASLVLISMHGMQMSDPTPMGAIDRIHHEVPTTIRHATQRITFPLTPHLICRDGTPLPQRIRSVERVHGGKDSTAGRYEYDFGEMCRRRGDTER